MDRVLKGPLSLKIVNLIITFTAHHNYFHFSMFFVLLSFGVSACGVYNFVDVFNFLIKKVKIDTIRFCLILPHSYFILFTNRLYYYKVLIRLLTDKNIIKMLCTFWIGLCFTEAYSEVVLNGPQQALPNGPVHLVPILNSVLLSESLLHSFIALFLL